MRSGGGWAAPGGSHSDVSTQPIVKMGSTETPEALGMRWEAAMTSPERIIGKFYF